MKEQIKKLEDQLKELKQAYTDEQKIQYESSKHKHFEKGDVVTDGSDILIVEWTENNAIEISYDKGYMGCSRINKRRGFCTFKRDEFSLVEGDYYSKPHLFEIILTGFQIEDIKYCLGERNVNPNKTKTKFLDALDRLK
jgi:hypothetical protein